MNRALYRFLVFDVVATAAVLLWSSWLSSPTAVLNLPGWLIGEQYPVDRGTMRLYDFDVAVVACLIAVTVAAVVYIWVSRSKLGRGFANTAVTSAAISMIVPIGVYWAFALMPDTYQGMQVAVLLIIATPILCALLSVLPIRPPLAYAGLATILSGVYLFGSVVMLALAIFPLQF